MSKWLDRLKQAREEQIGKTPNITDRYDYDREVAWRVEALRGQLPAHGPIIVPPVRPGFVWAGVASRMCSLCGDALSADRQFRCGPCVRAVEAVLNELREGVASDGQ